MAPVVYDAPPWASNDDEVKTFGPEASSCLKAARAAHVGSARLYRVDSDALLDVRGAIRGARPGAPVTRESLDMLALFDQSLAAIMEARRARTALVREAPHPSPEAVDKIRARAMLVKLDDYGHKRSDAIGIEAKAIARVVAANAFMQISRVEPLVRPYVAEPLFTTLFGSEFLSESPDEPPATWRDYLAAAARAIPRASNGAVAEATGQEADSGRKAVGGGPVEDERGDLRAVAGAAAADLRSLAAKLAPGNLRVALERTAANLTAFDIDSAVSQK
jgi:hypothetical protein